MGAANAKQVICLQFAVKYDADTVDKLEDVSETISFII